MTKRFIGLMAGTSLDGVDAVLVRFGNASPVIEAAVSRPYPDRIRHTLRAIGAGSPLADVVAADQAVADAFGEAVRALLAEARQTAEAVTAIGSHGQTVWHRPGAPKAASVQIGDPSRIAEATGITTVADFRRRDIAAGGEGAPLAPAFHLAILQGQGSGTAVLNLGGIANLTVGDAAGGPIGFDCGPANTLMDRWTERHLGERYDADGAWGAGGAVIPELLERLLADPFFRQPPPKSTGPERFGPDWLDDHLAALPCPPAPVDVQATLADLTARTVADALSASTGGSAAAPGRLLVCGGGVHNTHLMGTLRRHLPGWQVGSTEEIGIDPDFVEAAAFAWLARETLAGRPGNLPGVTGARRPVVLGGIYPA
ncbi:anhydro-N-acetylmuramic acid kinase [Arhodomonas aquaeolei]|uniref:anhydro-N-acetylmuramic acid kinase n=1 Tax=Arhodomonas aquaeolei TaxID=2369 RepID=UPI0021686B21|nr:anhydro-N-acetylmuramic acid kinase [Arhodomonas aquaeolei]MCS4504215.1 anhydro-N-acetylmuramic acid kinase [Arhodomonas aquaeolei]